MCDRVNISFRPLKIVPLLFDTSSLQTPTTRHTYSSSLISTDGHIPTKFNPHERTTINESKNLLMKENTKIAVNALWGTFKPRMQQGLTS